MYVQMTIVEVPLGKMVMLRNLILSDYLPVIRKQNGFMRAYLMEQVDDPDAGQLIQVWESQSALEACRRTVELKRAQHKLFEEIPGLQLQNQDYIVRFKPEETA